MEATVHDFDWHGTGTNQPATNEHFMDHVRKRNVKDRKPNDLLIQHEGAYARVTRSSKNMKVATRFGQPWDLGEVVSSTMGRLRAALEAAPQGNLCFCKQAPCANTVPAMHMLLASSAQSTWNCMTTRTSQAPYA